MVECSLVTSDSELPLLSVNYSSSPSHRNQSDSFNILDFSSDVGSDLTSSLCLFDLDELPPLSPGPELQLDSPHPTSSPKTVTAPRKGGLHSYFPIVHLGKRSHDADVEVSLYPPKRSQTQPLPHSPPQEALKDTPQPSSKQAGKRGKSMANKMELNKAVAAGSFKCDKSKWERFKLKISGIDPHSEVDNNDPKHAWDVLHIKCGKVICMATVYDVTLYKCHV
jgi:hypothetical protein